MTDACDGEPAAIPLNIQAALPAKEVLEKRAPHDRSGHQLLRQNRAVWDPFSADRKPADVSDRSLYPKAQTDASSGDRAAAFEPVRTELF